MMQTRQSAPAFLGHDDDVLLHHLHVGPLKALCALAHALPLGPRMLHGTKPLSAYIAISSLLSKCKVPWHRYCSHGHILINALCI